MWHPASRSSSQMEERVTEDNNKRKQHRRWKCDGNDSNDDDYGSKYDEDEAGNVDSGFLSGGNLQLSGEISSGLLLQSQEEERRGAGEEGERGRQVVAAAEATTPASASPSPSAVAIADEEPMRAIDSGVDLDLTETLSQLSLKQVSLNPLAAKGSKLIQVESTVPELLPVSLTRIDDEDDDATFKRHRVDDEEHCATTTTTTSNEEPWQLYYTQNDDGDTQLHIAVIQGFVEAALCLIRMAPDPCLLDTLNDDWQSPLYLAVLTHQPLIVRRLILAGADPSLRNLRGDTALHLACRNGDIACAKALTDPLSLTERNKLMPSQIVPALPQNLEQRNYSGEMCLHVAAAKGYVDLVRLLLRLGADLRAKEGLAGYTALHLAVEHKYWPLFVLLLPEYRRASCLDEQTYGGRTAYQLTLDINGEFARKARRELMRHGAMPEPLPESDSESSEDEEMTRTSWTASYLPVQNAVGVTV